MGDKAINAISGLLKLLPSSPLPAATILGRTPVGQHRKSGLPLRSGALPPRHALPADSQGQALAEDTGTLAPELLARHPDARPASSHLRQHACTQLRREYASTSPSTRSTAASARASVTAFLAEPTVLKHGCMWLGRWPSRMPPRLSAASRGHVLLSAIFTQQAAVRALLALLRSVEEADFQEGPARPLLQADAGKASTAWWPKLDTALQLPEVMAACCAASSSAPLASDFARAATTCQHEPLPATLAEAKPSLASIRCFMSLVGVDLCKGRLTGAAALQSPKVTGLASLHHELSGDVEPRLLNSAGLPSKARPRPPPELPRGVRAALSAGPSGLKRNLSRSQAGTHTCSSNFFPSLRLQVVPVQQALSGQALPATPCRCSPLPPGNAPELRP